MSETRYETLLTKREEHALHVTLNRPDARNAMSRKMLDELQGIFDRCAQDYGIRVIFLRGAGGNFCAGGDIRDMAAAAASGPQAYAELNRQFGAMISRANHLPQVLVTILEGAVLGGGFGLACVSDLAIAADNAQFGLPETGLGVIPAQIAPFIVQRIGLAQARRLALLGLRIDAEEAVRLGIAHTRAESDADLTSQIEQAILQTRRCAPEATRMTKSLLHRAGNEPLDALLDDAANLFAAAVTGTEGREGTLAFMQKRLPSWAT